MMNKILNTIQKNAEIIVVMVFVCGAFVNSGCFESSQPQKTPAKEVQQETSIPVDYTCSSLDEAKPLIRAALSQTGQNDVIVRVLDTDTLELVTPLTAEKVKTELIARFSVIASVVATFAPKGKLNVRFLSGTDSKDEMAVVSCDISRAREMSKGSLSWPEFLKTITVRQRRRQ